MEEFTIKSRKRIEVIDITRNVLSVVKKSGINEGICLVYVPHATAAITINENYDPNVCEDFMNALEKIAPRGIWKHDRIDGNGDAHIKAAIVGPSVVVPIKNSNLVLGTWQGIMFCEFDGPRERRVIVVCK